ncbi:hypothetical protein LIER_27385 [Lithospermum erythrorhizon]|uniref:Uncharacterized protein n=1 Tax=Lithospermum erythrorhizon TaxID=34254 RepID=A0AAV3RD20_LITER
MREFVLSKFGHVEAAYRASQVYVSKQQPEGVPNVEEVSIVEGEGFGVVKDTVLESGVVEDRADEMLVQDPGLNSTLVGAVIIPTLGKDVKDTFLTVGGLSLIVEGSGEKSCAPKSYAALVATPTVLGSMDQHILSEVQVIGGSFFLFFSIYGANVYVKRRCLWQSLVEVRALLVLQLEEFNSCLNIIDVVELNSQGCLYTWEPNRRTVEGNVRKLDYVFCNEVCLEKFTQSSTHLVKRLAFQVRQSYLVKRLATKLTHLVFTEGQDVWVWKGSVDGQVWRLLLQKLCAYKGSFPLQDERR